MKITLTKSGRSGKFFIVEGTNTLKNAEGIFYGIQSLYDFSQIDLSNLESGKSLLESAGTAKQFSGNLQKLKNGEWMFSSSKFTSFTSDLKNLINGRSMFSSSDIVTFNSDLSSLVNGSNMFSWSDLKSFTTTNLNSILIADYMFERTDIQTFTTNVSKLKIGDNMFQYCDKLETIQSDFSSLVIGGYLCFYCTNLKNFDGKLLSNLVTGSKAFTNCKLNASSVLKISNNIKDINSLFANPIVVTSWPDKNNCADGLYKYKDRESYLYSITVDGTVYQCGMGATERGWPGDIDIDIDTTNLTETDLQTIQSAVQTMTNKGWTVTSNTITSSAAANNDEGQNDTSVYARLETEDVKNPTHYDKDGNGVFLSVVKSVFSKREHHYTLFASKEDAENYFGLTRIEQQ